MLTLTGNFWMPDFSNSSMTEGRSLPTGYAMVQNYPNPFNPVTRIVYHVPEVSNVRMIVSNVLGDELVTIFKGQQMPGQYTRTWDGTDENGQSLGSGVYILRLQAGGFTQVRKMMLIR